MTAPPLNISAYQALIKQRCGLLFEGADRHKLTDALRQRSSARAVPLPAYYPLLEKDADEFQQLINLLTINETYFFREPQQIDWLVHHLAPRLLTRTEGQTPVRILSAGCSSGEEPYSIAMALLEKYGASTGRLFTLLAADIDSDMLRKAQAGSYSEFSFRGVSEAIRSRYFSPCVSGYQIHTDVSQLVRFAPLNLLAEPFDPDLQQCDVIFLRNVSIYFDSETRKQIQRNLANLLKEDGILIIGMAETLANDLGVLPMASEQGLYYFYKGATPSEGAALPTATHPLSQPAASAPQPANPPRSAPAPLTPPKDWAQPAPTPVWDLEQIRPAVRDKLYDQALIQLTHLLADQPQHTEGLLLMAHILLERKNFAAAQTLAQQVLAQDEWSSDAWLLLGLAAKWQNDADQALRCFKQTLYAQQGCWPAQYFLAELWRSSGDHQQARRGYRVVLQLLGNGDTPTGLRYLPLDLPASQIRFLCQHQLAKLEAG